MISNQTNTKATPVRKILDIIVDGQNRDINLFTKGHLNERNLLQSSTEEKFNFNWENSQKPHILQRPPLLAKKSTNVNEKKVKKMLDTLTEFSSGSPLHSQRNVDKSKTNKKLSDVYVEELKLPDIIVAKSHPRLTKSYMLPNKEPNQTDNSLPKVEVNESYPRSDLEMGKRKKKF
jgi:hypothetical protein